MPLLLPVGTLPEPFVFDPLDALTASRVTRYRFDLLDQDENVLGQVKSVTPAGGVEWAAYASVKGGGTMTVRDIRQPIDWLNDRVRPVVITSGVEGPETETPLGVFLAAAPVEQWDELGRVWDVELADKCSILDTDIVTTPAGQPMSFTAAKGVNVIATVVAIITATGEKTPAIEPSPVVLPSALVWDRGVSRLTIINDILTAAGFASLWCDGQGQFQVTAYVDPGARVPVYEAVRPFSKGPTSVMSPQWQRDRNIYEVPNRYVAISQGDGATEGMVAVATNTDVLSPFSFQARGRWITRVVDGVEVVSQTELNTRARQGLSQSTSISSGITVSNLFLPAMLVNTTVRFTNPDAGIDFDCIVTRVSVPFDPLAMCTADLREVIA